MQLLQSCNFIKLLPCQIFELCLCLCTNCCAIYNYNCHDLAKTIALLNLPPAKYSSFVYVYIRIVFRLNESTIVNLEKQVLNCFDFTLF